MGTPYVKKGNLLVTVFTAWPVGWGSEKAAKRLKGVKGKLNAMPAIEHRLLHFYDQELYSAEAL